MHSLCEAARSDLRFVLESIQVDRPETARAVALKLRCLATDALIAGDRATHSRAVDTAAAADRWHAGDDPEDARVAVLTGVLGIARALLLPLY